MNLKLLLSLYMLVLFFCIGTSVAEEEATSYTLPMVKTTYHESLGERVGTGFIVAYSQEKDNFCGTLEERKRCRFFLITNGHVIGGQKKSFCYTKKNCTDIDNNKVLQCNNDDVAIAEISYDGKMEPFAHRSEETKSMYMIGSMGSTEFLHRGADEKFSFMLGNKKIEYDKEERKVQETFVPISPVLSHYDSRRTFAPVGYNPLEDLFHLEVDWSKMYYELTRERYPLRDLIENLRAEKEGSTFFDLKTTIEKDLDEHSLAGDTVIRARVIPGMSGSPYVIRSDDKHFGILSNMLRVEGMVARVDKMFKESYLVGRKALDSCFNKFLNDERGYEQTSCGQPVEWKQSLSSRKIFRVGCGHHESAYGENSSGYGGDDMGYSGDDMGYSGDDMGYSGDDMGYSGDDMGYSGDDMGYSGDDMGYSGDDMGYSGDDMSLQFNDINLSSQMSLGLPDTGQPICSIYDSGPPGPGAEADVLSNLLTMLTELPGLYRETQKGDSKELDRVIAYCFRDKKTQKCTNIFADWTLLKFLDGTEEPVKPDQKIMHLFEERVGIKKGEAYEKKDCDMDSCFTITRGAGKDHMTLIYEEKGKVAFMVVLDEKGMSMTSNNFHPRLKVKSYLGDTYELDITQLFFEDINAQRRGYKVHNPIRELQINPSIPKVRLSSSPLKTPRSFNF